MKTRLEIGKPNDINGLVFRQMDMLEMREAVRMPPQEQVHLSWVNSEKMRWTVWYGDQVACVLGCAGEKGKFGVPWLLGTDLSKKVKKAFLNEIKDCLRIMLKEYRFLINYVHPQNKQSIRWLKWLGFTVVPPKPFGDFGKLFHPFYMREHV